MFTLCAAGDKIPRESKCKAAGVGMVVSLLTITLLVVGTLSVMGLAPFDSIACGL